MPPHPLDASLNHVINGLLKNILAANQVGDVRQVQLDVQHALFLSDLLNDHLLYDNQFSQGFDRSRFQDYLDAYLPRYAQYTKEGVLKNLETDLDFLRQAIAGYYHHGNPQA